jgi:hypothetical protein
MYSHSSLTIQHEQQFNVWFILIVLHLAWHGYYESSTVLKLLLSFAFVTNKNALNFSDTNISSLLQGRPLPA